MPWSLLGAGLLVATYLLPRADAPWFSFWRDWLAAVASLAIAFDLARRSLGAPAARSSAGGFVGLNVTGMAVLLAAATVLQHATGLVPWRGDAVLVASLFLAAGVAAGLARQQAAESRDRLVDVFAAVFAIASVVSVPIAVGQWLGILTLDLGIPVSGGRPVGQLEQANQFCSLLLLGMCGTWRLRARGRLHPALAGLAVAGIGWAVMLTQSRTAWLFAAVMVLVAIARTRLLSRRTILWIALLALALAVSAVVLPWVDQLTGLKGADIVERTSAGRRPEIWRMTVAAIALHPWAGWGVLSNGAAQYLLAPDFPSFGYVVTSAHDLPLDLMLWFGVPLGGLAAASLYLAVARRLVAAREAASLAAAAMPAVLALHALVEFPLHYAYFLLPFAFMLGATTPPSTAPGPAFRRSWPPVPRWAARAGWLTGGALAIALLAELPAEYVRLTDIRPVVTTDAASQHDVLSASAPPPEGIHLLDQLQAFHRFAHPPIDAPADAATLDAMRVTMLRFPFGPAIERYSRLMAAHGRDSEAREALRRICLFETGPQCLGTELAWGAWRRGGAPLPEWPGRP